MGKTLKQRWRKEAAPGAEEAVVDQNVQREVAAQTVADELFSIDTAGLTTRKRFRSAEERRGQVIFEKEPRLLSEGELQRVLIESRKMKMNNAPKPKEAEPEIFDAWAPEPPKPPVKDPLLEKFGEVKPVKKPDTMRARPMNSLAPSIKHAHGGQSINPKREQYEELLGMAAEREKAKERMLQDLHDKRFPMSKTLIDLHGKEAVEKMTQAERLAAFAKTYRPDVDSEEEEAKERARVAALPPVKKHEKKTIAQRNKEARHRRLMGVINRKKEQKKFNATIEQAPRILKEIIEREKQLEKEREAKEALWDVLDEKEKKGVMLTAFKCGKHTFSDLPDVATLPKEDGDYVDSGMRQAQLAMGSAVRDRMASIYRRKLLPAPPKFTMELQDKTKAQVKKREWGRKYVHPMLRKKNKR